MLNNTGGTTSMWGYLTRHPQVKPAAIGPNEPSFYSKGKHGPKLDLIRRVHCFAQRYGSGTTTRITIEAWRRMSTAYTRTGQGCIGGK